MSILLSIDTSTPHCSVAIAKEGEIIAFTVLSVGMSHSSHLTRLIEQTMANVGLTYTDLTAVAVSEGPGSYTGLRIGVSVAKGLCYAHDLKLLSVSTLDVLAYCAVASLQTVDYVVPMLDARRMEVYTKVLTPSMVEVESVQPLVLDEESFGEYLTRGTVCFVGDGAYKFREICSSEKAIYMPELFPSAKQVALLASKKLALSEFEDVAYFEPFYLKEFYTKAKG